MVRNSDQKITKMQSNFQETPNQSYPQKTKSQPPKNSKSKMLIVGTSLNRNLHKQVIKNVTDCEVTFSEAFTVDRDNKSRDPNKNFSEVVPNELAKDNFDVLIINSGPNEISNLNTSPSEYNKNIIFWKDEVYKTSQKIFDLAQQRIQI